MRRAVPILAVLGVVLGGGGVAFGLGASLPNGPVNYPQWPAGLNELVNRPNRIGGYFVNSNDFFFFTGDTDAFNEFLEQYAKVKGSAHVLILHPGRGTAAAPWDTGTTKPCEWQLSVYRRGWGGPAVEDPGGSTYTAAIDLALGGRVALHGLKVPLNVEVRSGGEIEKLIKEHEARRAANEKAASGSGGAAPGLPALLTEPQRLGSAPFAIYLLKDPSVTGAEAAKVDFQKLPLQPKPLLTIDDFTSYSWKDHSFALKPGAEKKIPEVKSVWGVPFVAVAQGKRLYLGAFWTSESSASFPHPVIDVFAARAFKKWTIGRAYPGTGAGESPEDPRANPAIKAAFAKAGKLMP